MSLIRRTISLGVIATVLGAGMAAPARAQGADALIDRAQAAWARIRTLRATFEQTIINPLTGSSMISRGELQQRKPDRLSIVFAEPDGDRIVADGRYVWLYLPSAAPGQVIRTPEADLSTASTDLIGQFLETRRSAYDAADAGADTVAGRAARALILTAKPGKAVSFIRAKVWIDVRDGLIRQFEATDANGISRHVRLLTLSPNASVDNASFTFSVPAGVRIVDQ